MKMYNYSFLENTEHVESFMKEVMGRSRYYHHLHGGVDRKGIFVTGTELSGDRGELYINACSQQDGRKKNERYMKKYLREKLEEMGNGADGDAVNSEVDMIDECKEPQDIPFFDFENQYPQNLKMSTCSYNTPGSAKLSYVSEIVMTHIRIDHTYKNGRMYPTKVEKVIEKFETEVLASNVIPRPTYYLIDCKFSLLYVFERPVEATKELMSKIDEQMKRICAAINAVDENLNAEYKRINDEIYIPGVRAYKSQKVGGVIEAVGNHLVAAIKHNKFVPLREWLEFPVIIQEKNEEIGINETRLFLNILMHDVDYGYLTTTRKFEAMEAVTQDFYKGKNEIHISSGDKGAEYYVGLYPLNKRVQSSDWVDKRTAIYIDLDIPSGLDEASFLRIRNAVRRELTLAFEEGGLPKPTMMVDSGRGYALYYVLYKGFPPKVNRMDSYFLKIVECLNYRYREFLKEKNLQMRVDSSNKMKFKLCRLPGSINQRNGRKCSILMVNTTKEGEVEYCTLNQLREAIGLENYSEQMQVVKKEKKNNKLEECQQGDSFCVKVNRTEDLKRKHPEKARKLTNLFKRRVYWILNYLEEINYCCYGGKYSDLNQRDTVLFHLFNILTGIMDEEDAWERIYLVNSYFNVPMKEAEVRNNLMSVIRIRKLKKQGYPYSSEDIMKELGIWGNEELLEKIGYGEQLWELNRKEQVRAHKQRLLWKEQRVMDLLLCSPNIPMEELAELTNSTMAWLKKLLKKYSISLKDIRKGLVLENPVKIKNRRIDNVIEFMTPDTREREYEDDYTL